MLRKKYKERKDYEKVSKTHELVQNFYSDCNRYRKLPGNKASYYIITGRCLKLILMCLRTQIAVETRKYYIKIEELAIFMKDYVQALQIHNINLQRELHKKQLEEKDKQLIESKEAIEEEKRKNVVLTSFVERAKPHEKTQIFYIATSNLLMKNNRFKFGGVEDETKLKTRLKNYSPGRAGDNKIFYVRTMKCYNYRQLESRLKAVITSTFKDSKSSRNELVHCHFIPFERLVNILIDSHDKDFESFNSIAKEMFEMTTDSKKYPPVTLKPMVFKKKKEKEDENSEEKIIVDKENLTDDAKINLLKTIINRLVRKKNKSFDYEKQKDENLDIVINWKDVIIALTTTLNVNQKKLKVRKEWIPKLKTLGTANCIKKIKWR